MRLHGLSYNDEQWCVKGSRDSRYQLVNRATLDSYSISGDVIGIEQIGDDTFLVYRNFTRDTCKIERLKLNNGQLISEYNHEFRHFSFLTDDIIIFDYSNSSHGAKLYSISKNCELNDLNHLISGTLERHDASYISGREITLLYESNKDSKYPIYLLIDYTLNYAFYTREHLQLILDVNSLQPIAPLYSTLRDKYFILSNTLTLKDIVEEENRYLRIIESFLRNFYKKDNRKSVKELLSIIPQTE